MKLVGSEYFQEQAQVLRGPKILFHRRATATDVLDFEAEGFYGLEDTFAVEDEQPEEPQDEASLRAPSYSNGNPQVEIREGSGIFLPKHLADRVMAESDDDDEVSNLSKSDSSDSDQVSA